MDDETRAFVRQRAGNRCEYCRIQQRYYPDVTFHVEHIIARQHYGPDDLENLALACHLCNRKKGPNLAGIAPDTGALTRLSHPRLDSWEEHFRLDDNGQIVGRTAIGHATAYVLDMNSAIRRHIRREILQLAAKEAE